MAERRKGGKEKEREHAFTTKSPLFWLFDCTVSYLANNRCLCIFLELVFINSLKGGLEDLSGKRSELKGTIRGAEGDSEHRIAKDILTPNQRFSRYFPSRQKEKKIGPLETDSGGIGDMGGVMAKGLNSSKREVKTGGRQTRS